MFFLFSMIKKVVFYKYLVDEIKAYTGSMFEITNLSYKSYNKNARNIYKIVTMIFNKFYL